MTFADQIDDHQSRCQPQLLRLRMLARGETGAALSRQVTAEVREATNTVIAAAEAAGRAALAATVGTRGEAGAETFLWVRLARLAGSADKAVSAARTGDANGLRRHLHRFDALATAIWAVQHAVYGQVPPRNPCSGPAQVDGSFGPGEGLPLPRPARREGRDAAGPGPGASGPPVAVRASLPRLPRRAARGRRGSGRPHPGG